MIRLGNTGVIAVRRVATVKHIQENDQKKKERKGSRKEEEKELAEAESVRTWKSDS